MDADSLLCWTLIDLDACMRSTWHYHQLRIAALVRLLLFDEHPLVHQSNRTHRLKLSFEFGPGISATAPDPALDLTHDGVRFAAGILDPRRVDATSSRCGSLSEWLSAPAFRVDGHILSVQEFVQNSAYVEGVVHAGSPRNPVEASTVIARKSDHRLALNLSTPHLDLLKQIGHVTYDGLRPLFAEARKPREAGGDRYPTFTYL